MFFCGELAGYAQPSRTLLTSTATDHIYEVRVIDDNDLHAPTAAVCSDSTPQPSSRRTTVPVLAVETLTTPARASSWRTTLVQLLDQPSAAPMDRCPQTRTPPLFLTSASNWTPASDWAGVSTWPV